MKRIIKEENKKLRVVVGMSGGVDSSVAAALLQKQSYEVIGVFLKFWHESKKKGIGICENKCCSTEAQRDARRVANILKVPFYAIDVSKEFKKRVVDYFIGEYKKGNTPNPCIECNKWIKFGIFLEKAKRMGADYVATGHYSRLSRGFPIKLLTAKDKDKDQSYFLWRLDQTQLAKIIFPIGNYQKSIVRKMAQKFDLPVFKKKDSQEVCFIGSTLKEFLASRLTPKAGSIVGVNGEKIGKHEGLFHYTIGQRRGINIGGTGPYYVINKDFKKNFLVVSSSENDLLKKEMVVKNIHWVSGQSPQFPFFCQVKIRYMSDFVKCKLVKLERGKLRIVFQGSVRAITPGQSAVFYSKGTVVGGGVII